MPSLTFDLSGLDRLSDRFSALEDAIAEEIQVQLQHVQEVWLSAVSGEQLPGMERAVNNPYYQEVLQRGDAIQYPVGGDKLHGRVAVEGEVASRVEKGRPARDMKPGLLNGPHSRVGKRGQRFNVIPLGFNALKPGAFSPGRASGMLVGTSPFRVVSSDRSPADSWIYPATPGVAVMEAVRSAVEPVVNEAMQRVVREWRS